MVAAGTFRADFYYRISSVTLRIPPLRERRREIARFAERFAHPRLLSPTAIEALARYDWPGNIRQLRNVIEAASVSATGDVIDAADLRLPSARPSSAPVSVPPAAPPNDGLTPAERDERDRILAALTETAGNQTRAARLLGISRGTLYARLDKYGIRRPQGKR
jgi:DNA-binding NtrC family response regulator